VKQAYPLALHGGSDDSEPFCEALYQASVPKTFQSARNGKWETRNDNGEKRFLTQSRKERKERQNLSFFAFFAALRELSYSPSL